MKIKVYFCTYKAIYNIMLIKLHHKITFCEYMIQDRITADQSFIKFKFIIQIERLLDKYTDRQMFFDGVKFNNIFFLASIRGNIKTIIFLSFAIFRLSINYQLKNVLAKIVFLEDKNALKNFKIL